MVLTFVLDLPVLVFAALSVLTACNVIKSQAAATAFAIVNKVFCSLLLVATVYQLLITIMPSLGNGGKIYIPFELVVPVVFAIALIVLTTINRRVVKKHAATAVPSEPKEKAE